ncbi:MAG: coniferyl aldehyde dehydrogenase [Sphingomonadales bacterium]
MTSLSESFEAQRSLSRNGSVIGYDQRMEALDKLLAMTLDNEGEIIASIAADFGTRCPMETIMGDILMTITNLKENRKQLRKWMKPRRVKTAKHYWPGSSHIKRQALGVVGVISPWNYPFQLAMVPAAQAIAAGNRVLIKPSELTPNTSNLMARLIANNFDANYLMVVLGDNNVGREFSKLPFDHLVFTGSTEIGRHVAKAAAANLTPVTLELGGKSPTIFGRSANLDKMIPRFTFGKMLNAGQTCVAPDYVFVPQSSIDDFVACFARTIKDFYPGGADEDSFTSIISDRHFLRLNELLDDAKAKGAYVTRVGENLGEGVSNQKKFAPAILTNVNDDMRVMQEEIFGPILPVMDYRDISETIRYINAHERPLALYIFSEDKKEQRQILDQTIAGGVTVNDTLCHLAQENLPFGGVGASGMGSYHGEHGFITFSKEKPIFTQSRFSSLNKLYPPYGKQAKFLINFVRKIM